MAKQGTRGGDRHKGSPVRGIRIFDEVWDATQAKASDSGETAQQVVNGPLAVYTGVEIGTA
jgi:hypothetical protein